jgi:hypothetical protein
MRRRIQFMTIMFMTSTKSDFIKSNHQDPQNTTCLQQWSEGNM